MAYGRGGKGKKADANHYELIAAAVGVGADVVDTHTIGEGVPDFIVIYRDRVYLVEAKTQDGRLTESEKRYAQRSRTPVHIIRTVDELLRMMGIQA